MLYDSHYAKGDDMKPITIEEERIGQYATRRRAQKAAKMEGARTGRLHRIIFTTCYRALEPRTCWALYLDRGIADARFRAYGE